MAIQEAIEELRQVARQLESEIEQIANKITGFKEEIAGLENNKSVKWELFTKVSEVVANLQSLTPLVPKPAKVQEVPIPEVAPKPEATLRTAPEPYGVSMRARRILRTAFSAAGKPTFEGALQTTYGDNWKEEVLSSTVNKAGVRTDIRFVDEEGRLFLLDSIQTAVAKLKCLHDGKVPEGARPTTSLRNLYRELDWADRGDEISEIVQSWWSKESKQAVSGTAGGIGETEKPKATKTKKWGLDQIPSKIIRKSFQNGQAPSSLQQALEYAYGDSLSDQIIMVPTGGNKTTMQKIPLLEAATSTNVVQTRLGHMLKKLVSIKVGQVPTGIVVDDKLMNLFMAVEFRTRGDEIVSTMKQWGVTL